VTGWRRSKPRCPSNRPSSWPSETRRTHRSPMATHLSCHTRCGTTSAPALLAVPSFKHLRRPRLTILVVIRIIRIDRPHEIDKQAPDVLADRFPTGLHEFEPVVQVGKRRIGRLPRRRVGDMGQGRGRGGECGREEDLPEGDGCGRRRRYES
jgi:hypothetical protein